MTIDARGDIHAQDGKYAGKANTRPTGMPSAATPTGDPEHSAGERFAEPFTRFRNSKISSRRDAGSSSATLLALNSHGVTEAEIQETADSLASVTETAVVTRGPDSDDYSHWNVEFITTHRILPVSEPGSERYAKAREIGEATRSPINEALVEALIDRSGDGGIEGERLERAVAKLTPERFQELLGDRVWRFLDELEADVADEADED